MELCKTKIDLKDNFKVKIFLNTLIKINIIFKKLMKNIYLAIKQKSKLKLVSYIRYNYLFFGFCKKIQIVIKDLKIKYPIFVIKIRDYDVLN